MKIKVKCYVCNAVKRHLHDYTLVNHTPTMTCPDCGSRMSYYVSTWGSGHLIPHCRKNPNYFAQGQVPYYRVPYWGNSSKWPVEPNARNHELV